MQAVYFQCKFQLLLIHLKIINSVDESYFIANIINGFKMRKIKSCDKKEEKFEMPTFMYKLLVNSNQVSRKKGKALSYIMSDKERAKPNRSNRTHYERVMTFKQERDHIIENRAAQF